jgi:recombination protein RecA
MPTRRRQEDAPASSAAGGLYFAAPKSGEFIPTGSTLLDLALGGGWARQRVGNIIGDKSTGKTLLMIEACANFARTVPKGKIRYREFEAAFDKDYAAALGMPVERVDFGDPNQPAETVEDLAEELEYRIQHSKTPELIIVDSLDAVRTRAELKRGFDEASFATEKAKAMSKLFRCYTTGMAARDITLLVVSQIRDNIGVTFGRKWTRNGGHAMDFYASQILVLAQTSKTDRAIDKVTRTVAINIKAKVDKNKISLAYRDAEFPILFGYGVDDDKSLTDWLTKVGVAVPALAKNPSDEQRAAWRRELRALATEHWYAIERKFLPTERKYD